ncbi:MAG TPA: Gfo/Idh/MocA family oxidoreductase [Actinomycetales bacterium]|jgi:predicted dehydrogenase
MTSPQELASRPVRLGVIGSGGIAGSMTRALDLLPDAEMVAVGSRTQQSADAFGDEHGVARRHGSYESLATDPEVDVVYVATTHPSHHAAAMLAIEAGKALLVEKPFTMDATEALDIVTGARERGTFVMEAMWARFNPHMVAVRDTLASGALGEVVSVIADHAQWFPLDANHRLFDPSVGGGALLDLGIYPVSFASMVLGTPSRVTARSTPAFTGVDGQTSIILEHESGAHALLSTTLRAAGSNRASIVGTEGRIEIDGTFYAPTGVTTTLRSGEVTRYDEPHEGHGLRHEVAEVVRCLRAGLTESPVMPADETVQIMRTMDEVRQQIGLHYS